MDLYQESVPPDAEIKHDPYPSRVESSLTPDLGREGSPVLRRGT